MTPNCLVPRRCGFGLRMVRRRRGAGGDGGFYNGGIAAPAYAAGGSESWQLHPVDGGNRTLGAWL